MNPREHTDLPAWMDERVEAYLDGDLARADADRFEQVLAEDADWEAELFLAARIRDGLRTMPQPVCPPAVTQAVQAAVRGQARRAWFEPVADWIARRWGPFWQPSLAMALLAALVVTATLVGRPGGTAPEASPATAEVQDALAEAKWTLAYLSQVGRQTGRSVRHDVLESRVVAPVQEALGTILDETPKTQN